MVQDVQGAGDGSPMWAGRVEGVAAAAVVGGAGSWKLGFVKCSYCMAEDDEAAAGLDRG